MDAILQNFPLCLDIIVGIILLVSAVTGLLHGFVRALCSFLGTFLAFILSFILVKILTPILIPLASPYFLAPLTRQIEELIPDAASLMAMNSLELMESLELPSAWAIKLDSLLNLPDSWEIALADPAGFLAQGVLNIVLTAVTFLICFFLLLLIFKIFSHSLEAIVKLPVLRTANALLGLLFGILKALIFVFLLHWFFCDVIGLISSETIAQTQVFKLFSYFTQNFQLSSFYISS